MTVALLSFLLLQIKCPALKRRDSSSYLCSSAAAKRFNHRHHLHNKPCSTTANNNSSSLSHFTFQSSLFNLFNQVQHYHHHHRINFDLFVILLCSLIRSVSQPVQSAMEPSQLRSSHRSHLVNKRRRRKMQSWSAPSSSSNERSLKFQRLKLNLNLAFSTVLLLNLLTPSHSQLSANQSNLFKTIENENFILTFSIWTSRHQYQYSKAKQAADTAALSRGAGQSDGEHRRVGRPAVQSLKQGRHTAM